MIEIIILIIILSFTIILQIYFANKDEQHEKEKIEKHIKINKDELDKKDEILKQLLKYQRR